LFSDYFANGNCPSLSGVRGMTAHSQLQTRRNASSIWAGEGETTAGERLLDRLCDPVMCAVRCVRVCAWLAARSRYDKDEKEFAMLTLPP
uniref:Secreted protein n=1 Tax=Mesocestoides corti TaxID=53468 RepID=A0A0R3UBU9_MESCO